MRGLQYLIVVPALALLVTACGPHHHRGRDGDHRRGGMQHMRMGHQSGHGACSYKSRWYSEGAVRSNDGVCQACNAGKWVAADGCREDRDCHHGHGKGWKGMKSGPCPHADDHSRGRRAR